MRRSVRRSLMLASVLALVAALAAPAHAARVVNGTVAPAKLKGRSTVAMFFHPF